jgi:hypothetical protein
MSADINDAATDRAMSEPFQSAAAADEALAAFDAELRELRRKHKITDVLCVSHFTVMSGGREAENWSSSFIGNVLMAEAMAAYSFARERAQARQRIARLLAEATKAGEE